MSDSHELMILLVEDDDGDAMLFERSLSSCSGDYRLEICGTLNQALCWLADHACDVVILDQSLPDCFGLNGIEEIHRCFAETPIVMLTGFDDDATALQTLEIGAQDYLVKETYTPRELQRTVRHAIQRQQLRNENRRLLAQLQRAASLDALTGLLNRHAMIEEFEKQWGQSSETGQPLSCVILDVDYFKKINDAHGHLAGDEVLRAVAQRIDNSTRDGDCVARYGGEEFCVILVSATESEAAQWAELARTNLSDSEIRLPDVELTVTASFGVAQRSARTKTIAELIDLADQALMMGKRLGRDQVFVASGELPLDERRDATVESSIEDNAELAALSSDESQASRSLPPTE